MKYADRIPYVFILDYLVDVDIVIKPMFGGYGVYSDGKLCLFLLNREKPLIGSGGATMYNGVYIAATSDNVKELKPMFDKAEFELLKDRKVWMFISETLDEFERYVIKACELINARDRRIGR